MIMQVALITLSLYINTSAINSL